MKKSPRQASSNRDTRSRGRPERSGRPERTPFEARTQARVERSEGSEKPQRGGFGARKKFSSDKKFSSERSDRPERGGFGARKKFRPERSERSERPETDRREPFKKSKPVWAERSERPAHKRDEGHKKFWHERSDRRNGPKRPHHEKKRERPERTEQRIDQRLERDPNKVMIWGLHAARAAWLNPKRKFFRVWLTEAGQKSFETTMEEGKKELLKRPDPKLVERLEMDRLLPHGSVHQGIILEAAPLVEPALQDIITGDNPPGCILMLDQVTDPHNIGAILRSAAALGAGAVIMTERNAPGTTGVLAKAASGAAEYVPQIHVVNLSRTLDELRQAGYWCVGLAEEGEQDLSACDLSGRTVLVLGAEGDGMRQLTRKKCDQLARLPTSGPVGSLNVSNAAAVALYEIARQKAKT